mmetsp:Transcript_21971/g.37596  ORF Transcript_21971/g.37596 Transcript_21971/m.37596 type:complete len:215 (-) Transcript_21971:792-1436(-)
MPSPTPPGRTRSRLHHAAAGPGLVQVAPAKEISDDSDESQPRLGKSDLKTPAASKKVPGTTPGTTPGGAPRARTRKHARDVVDVASGQETPKIGQGTDEPAAKRVETETPATGLGPLIFSPAATGPQMSLMTDAQVKTVRKVIVGMMDEYGANEIYGVEDLMGRLTEEVSGEEMTPASQVMQLLQLCSDDEKAARLYNLPVLMMEDLQQFVVTG